MMKLALTRLRRLRRRLRRWAGRSQLLLGLFILAGATVLILGLPVILPLVAVLHARDLRRRRHAADTTVCGQCGKILGPAALARADTDWAAHMARLAAEHPGCRFRVVRVVFAVCTRCGARYSLDEKSATFHPYQEKEEPAPAAPFFAEADIARLIQGRPVGEPLPFEPGDDASIRRFYDPLVRQIEQAQNLRSRVEWNHYGSGYASFIEAWFFPADGRASLPPFQVGDERHVGLVVLLSRLSRYFVVGQDERSWSANGGSGGLPNFESVDEIEHAAIVPHVAPVTALLTAAGLRRLTREELAAPLLADAQVPTILTDQPFRQFDALFHWED